MAELHNLESIQELHADLLALSESRLSNIEKLQTQLVDHIKDFKALLDKKIRNNQSREALSTGTF
jgi:nuclear pore complex protein Nup205